MSARAIQDLLGGEVTLALRSQTSDLMLVFAREAGSVELRPRLVLEFGTGAPPADVSAPSVPVNVAAVVSGSDVSVSWDASTDDVGVTGYEIHRDSDAGFTPDGSTRSTRLDGSTLTYVEAAVPSGAWYYKVIAVDAADNSSGASEASAEVVPGVLVLGPVADARVDASSPSMSYGLSATLLTDSSPENLGLLRFSLPSVPAGQVVTGARLELATTTGLYSGSAGPVDIVVADNDWSEAGVTYENRPELTDQVLGSDRGDDGW